METWNEMIGEIIKEKSKVKFLWSSFMVGWIAAWLCVLVIGLIL